jgi:UDP-glucose 4-epimerase
VRDYIHVNDLAAAHIKALDHLQAGKESFAANLGTGHGHSVREVIATVEEVTGNRVPLRLSPRRPGDPPALVADPRRAESLLHWKAQRTLREIVSTAWNWMQCQPESAESIL